LAGAIAVAVAAIAGAATMLSVAKEAIRKRFIVSVSMGVGSN
jgi:hypothetical protein